MKLNKILLICLLSLGLSNIAVAQGYIGGSVGSSDVDVSGFDEADSIKIFGGIRNPNNNLGFELAYIDVGEFKVTGTNRQVEVDGLEFSGVGYLPLGNSFELFGKLGLFAWDATASISGLSLGTDDGVDFTYGIGAQFKPSNKVSIRLEYQIFNDVSGGDIDMISLGAAYHF